MGIVLFLMLIGAASAVERYPQGCDTNEVDAAAFLRQYNTEASTKCNFVSLAQWNYQNNLTENNKNAMLEALQRNAVFHKEMWQKATSFAWKNFSDPQVKRQFQKLSVLGDAILPEEKFKELNKLGADMEDIYSKATVKSPCGAQSLSLDPDLTKLFATSRNPDELKCYWEGWRDATGKKMRESYLRFVELSNEAARANGFNDTGEFWREPYESDTFESEVDELWQQVRPLYELLHAYVRKKLAAKYGESVVKPNGPIPAHLLGNMWAQTWGHLQDMVLPYPDKQAVDVTPELKRRNVTALQMFKISESFFKSLGLKAMTPEFWHHSVIVKARDRDMVCHASAWDMCDGEDFRIKQCTVSTMEDLVTVHHEMGHIQYYQQYAHQPPAFREGANPGFHEAIGDVLALSVATPNHLHKIGFLSKVENDTEADLNFLTTMALGKLAFVPFGYLMDLWRWGLFRGDFGGEALNDNWWKLRLKYQGVCPPVRRSEADFDPGAKYHVPGNTPYIRYFVSFVVQFQLHDALCRAAGHDGPLHTCDIYQSREAGDRLASLLRLGSSVPWQEALATVTGGSGRLDATPLLNYFSPLRDWLRTQTANDTIGWTSDDHNICP